MTLFLFRIYDIKICINFLRHYSATAHPSTTTPPTKSRASAYTMTMKMGGFQQLDQGRSQSRERSDSRDHSESRDQSASSDRNTSSCYRCGRSHQGTCPAIDKKCCNCLKMGHFTTNCKAPKAKASATSTSSASMWAMTIASTHNP